MTAAGMHSSQPACRSSLPQQPAAAACRSSMRRQQQLSSWAHDSSTRPPTLGAGGHRLLQRLQQQLHHLLGAQHQGGVVEAVANVLPRTPQVLWQSSKARCGSACALAEVAGGNVDGPGCACARPYKEGSADVQTRSSASSSTRSTLQQHPLFLRSPPPPHLLVLWPQVVVVIRVAHPAPHQLHQPLVRRREEGGAPLLLRAGCRPGHTVGGTQWVAHSGWGQVVHIAAAGVRRHTPGAAVLSQPITSSDPYVKACCDHHIDLNTHQGHQHPTCMHTAAAGRAKAIGCSTPPPTRCSHQGHQGAHLHPHLRQPSFPSPRWVPETR
jgi:hypothetical protein